MLSVHEHTVNLFSARNVDGVVPPHRCGGKEMPAARHSCHFRGHQEEGTHLTGSEGPRLYPAAPIILITADGGGSNGATTILTRGLWKLELQKFADQTGRSISVTSSPGRPRQRD